MELDTVTNEQLLMELTLRKAYLIETADGNFQLAIPIEKDQRSFEDDFLLDLDVEYYDRDDEEDPYDAEEDIED